MADGLFEVAKLSWREPTQKFIFHILDAPPHGSEFEYPSDNHKGGCPCVCKDYAASLDKLKNKKIKYYMVKLNSSVNKCFEIFQKIYGKD